MELPSIDAAIRRLHDNKGRVEAIAQLPEPHLMLVCIDLGGGEYVTWKVNLETVMHYGDCGCMYGDYFTDDNPEAVRERAMLSFVTRLASAYGWRTM